MAIMIDSEGNYCDEPTFLSGSTLTASDGTITLDAPTREEFDALLKRVEALEAARPARLCGLPSFPFSTKCNKPHGHDGPHRSVYGDPYG